MSHLHSTNSPYLNSLTIVHIIDSSLFRSTSTPSKERQQSAREELEESTFGNGLSDSYMATLTRLNAQKGDKSALLLKVSMRELYLERPFRAQELHHALGVGIRSVNLDWGKCSRVADTASIMSYCYCLGVFGYSPFKERTLIPTRKALNVD